MIRDLTELAVVMVKTEKTRAVQARANKWLRIASSIS